MTTPNIDHAWIIERIAAYLTGGLTESDRAQFDAHINTCSECFDAFSEARDADRTMQRLLAPLAPLTPPPPAKNFEDRVISNLREKLMKPPLLSPFTKRLTLGIAACLAFAATGVAANYVVQHDALNNPLTERLIADADKQGFNPLESIERAGKALGPLAQARVSRSAPSASANPRGLTESRTEYGGELALNGGTQPLYATDHNGFLTHYYGRTGTAHESSTEGIHDNYRPQSVEVALGETKQIVGITDHSGSMLDGWAYGGQQQKSAGNYENAQSPGGGEKDRGAIANANTPTVTSIAGSVSSLSTPTPAARPNSDQLNEDYSLTVRTPKPNAAFNEKGELALRYKPAPTNGKDHSYSQYATNGDGQKIGFGDGHVEFNHRSNSDINGPSDNIYTAGKGGIEIAKTPSDVTRGTESTERAGDLAQRVMASLKTRVDAGSKTNVRFEASKETSDSSAQTPTLPSRGSVKLADGTEALSDKPTEPGSTFKIPNTGTYKGAPSIVAGTSAPQDFVSNFRQNTDSAPPLLADMNAPERPAQPPTQAGNPQSESGSAKTPPVVQAPEIAQRKIIRNGDVEFEVRSFEDTYATVSNVITEEGGYVSSTSSDKLANGKVRGTIVVRVAPERLDRLLLKLRALGELKSQQIAANDVTKQYTDLESELRALRAMEERLLNLIKNGKGEVKDLVEAEKQLGTYRVRIEKIEGEIRYYNNLVGMATLTITAYEKDIQKPTAASEQENVNLSVETEDVETKYRDARKVIDDAKGRIVESELKKYDADQYAARIVADVAPDKADFIAAQLKQLGKVAGFNRDRKQTTTGGTGSPAVQVEQKDTRFTISLYNLANIAPRETTVLNVAVRDVEAAYKNILTLIRKESPKPADAAGSAEKPFGTQIGRIVSSNLSGQRPEQMTADIRADIRATDADAIIQAIRNTGEILTSTITENPDTANVTTAKRGIQLRFINVAAVPARELQTLRIVAASVPDAYRKLTTSLQTLETAGSARLIGSQLNETDPRTVTASLSFEVRRDSLPAIDKAFADAGIEGVSRNIVRSTDTSNTLDSKVRFQIDELMAAEALAPRRTTVLGIELDNVDKTLESFRASLSPADARELDYNLSKEPNGRVIGHLVIDVPVTSAMTVLTKIHDLGGNEKVNQVVKNMQVPDTRFAKERIDITLTSKDALVDRDKGLGSTLRAALGSAAAALLWSLYLIITGVLFIGPWLLIAWIMWRIFKRRKVATA